MEPQPIEQAGSGPDPGYSGEGAGSTGGGGGGIWKKIRDKFATGAAEGGGQTLGEKAAEWIVGLLFHTAERPTPEPGRTVGVTA
ncbi:hypothetical protein OG373_36980 [Streptomyces avidinii]|uniref:hypothetical protein n=1 Tax=Streptomyces avidinii TaxID=1895 RepID=UPI00386366F0|nr:hypothetical protein OG373_36980 [Streptomyces avidinii]